MTAAEPPLRRWGLFAVVSAIFFLITAATFTSLGVVLPYMIESLSWNWSQAGIGFSIFALMVGLSSTAPAWTMRSCGIKATFGIGGAVMACGFGLIALTSGLAQYYLGAGLLGFGYSLCTTVPSVHLISHWIPDRRSFAIGAYMTIGGLGGVAGPLIVTGIVAATGSWRIHWWLMCGAILLLAALAVAFVANAPGTAGDAQGARGRPQEKSSAGVFKTRTDWSFAAAMRTPQLYVIVAALTMTRLASLTMNSWGFTHLGILGVTTAVAAAALSADGAVNALARAVGGLLATRIDPKWLLAAALGGEMIGMLALSVADTPLVLAVFAIGEGFGFGMCFLATTLLLVNYFGTRENPEILGTVSLITTIGMIGPVLGGLMADAFGGFAALYQIYALVLLMILIATATMRPPRHAEDAAR